MSRELQAGQRLLIRFGQKEFALLRAGEDGQDLAFASARTAAGPAYICAGSWRDDSAGRGLMRGAIALVPGAALSFDAAHRSWLEAEAGSTDDNAPALRIFLSRTAKTPADISARLHLDGNWHDVGHVIVEGEPGLRVWTEAGPPGEPKMPPARVARFTSAFGIEAWQRLRASTAVVIGAGGTGSVAIPMLARAGVGRIVIVDFDHITPSNLERTHASFPEHVEAATLKAQLARDHVRQIDPDIEVIAFEGRLPQPEIVAEVARADVIVGCTDQHTSRMAVADMARRYLVPAIDCGGLIEGANGRVTGQIIQLVLFRPDDPCPVCRGMIDPVRVAQELMSAEEREALKAASTGGSIPPEAHEIPQIDTVGYITTVSGTLAAGYAIGWLTGRFDPPFERLQMNLISDCLDVTNRPQKHAPGCNCRNSRGLADAGGALAPFAPPPHWKPARLIP